jgi:hypothetical protein
MEEWTYSSTYSPYIAASIQFPAPAALPPKKDSQYPLNRRLGRPHSWSGCSTEEKTLFFLLAIEPQFLGCPVCSLVTIPNTIFKVI